MATQSKGGFFDEIRRGNEEHEVAVAKDRWERLKEVHPQDLHDGMIYKDFVELWNKKPEEFERDVWDTYALASGLDPRTGIPISRPASHSGQDNHQQGVASALVGTLAENVVDKVRNSSDKTGSVDPNQVSQKSDKMPLQSGHTEQFPVVNKSSQNPKARSGYTEKFVVFRDSPETFGPVASARPATPIYQSPLYNPGIAPQRSARQQRREDDGSGDSFTTARNARRIGRAAKNREGGSLLSKLFRPGMKNVTRQLVQQALITPMRAFFSTLPGGITLAFIFIVIIIVFVLVGLNPVDSLRKSSRDPVVPPITIGEPVPGGVQIPGLTLFLPPISAAPVGGSVVIPIEVSYSGSAEIDVIASIPPGARFVSATGSYNLSGDLVVWRLSSNVPTNPTGRGGGGMSPSVISLYNSYGFPNPSDPVVLADDELYRWNTFLRPHAERAAAIVGVDVGFIGMWPYHENRFMSHTDNCGDADGDPNTPCNWNTTMWQVGWGILPLWERQYLPEAMEAMHPGRSIQEVGQAVIDSSGDEERYPPEGSWFYNNYYYPYDSSFVFPDISLEELMIRSDRLSDLEAQKLVAALLKDDAIGAYILAKKWKGYADTNGRLGPSGNMSVADFMESWPPYDPYNRQRIINEIAGLYNVGAVRREYTFSLTLSPADGGNLGIRNYVVSGRVVSNGGGSVDF